MVLNGQKKTIQVFEYQKLEAGNGSGFEEEHWKALARYNEKHGNKYFSLLAGAVRFSNFVGVIQAGSLTIEILPKIDRTGPDDEPEKIKWHGILLQMLWACSLVTIDHIEEALLKLKSHSLLDIYISVFLKEIEYLLHKGLVKKYRRMEENSIALKGKLSFPRHIASNLIHQERFYTEHPVFDTQHKHNQILYEALLLIPRLTTHSVLRHKYSRLMLNFPELPRADINETTFSLLHFDKKTNHYSKAITIARMLLLNYRPDITTGHNHVIAILFDMNELWEEFVYRCLRSAASTGMTVQRQQSKPFWHADHALLPKKIRPDIVITYRGQTTVIDTKWKLVPGLVPSDEDLKQVFVYNLFWSCPHSFLLYPSIENQHASGKYQSFEFQGHPGYHCSVLAVNIMDQNGRLDMGIGEEILRKSCH